MIKNEIYVTNTKIESLETMYQLKQIIHSPTRITADSSTVIDVVLCSEHLLPIFSDLLHITLSDHYPVFANFEF